MTFFLLEKKITKSLRFFSEALLFSFSTDNHKADCSKTIRDLTFLFLLESLKDFRSYIQPKVLLISIMDLGGNNQILSKNFTFLVSHQTFCKCLMQENFCLYRMNLNPTKLNFLELSPIFFSSFQSLIGI